MKSPLITLLILTAVILSLQLGSGIYQAVVGFIGFNWSTAVVSVCPSLYLNLKLTLAYMTVSISFVMICVSACIVVVLLSIFIVGLIRFISSEPQ